MTWGECHQIRASGRGAAILYSMASRPLSRRTLLQQGTALAAALALPWTGRWSDPDQERLRAWSARLREEGFREKSTGAGAARVGELAAGSPYEAGTLETYMKNGGSPRAEPLILSLSHFDCVTLVEACLAVRRASVVDNAPTWDRFGAEVERMRYRGGKRAGYSSRLHYFSEWMRDGAARGLLRDLGQQLGGLNDERPLRFMTEHRSAYPALADDAVYAEIGAMERQLDGAARFVVPPARLGSISDQLESGDVLAFATSIAGLDVTHAAFAYRDRAGTLRVLHAPLSGGVVEVTRSTLVEYVAAIKRCTGVLVARPV